jgi:hypothetical protein
MKKFENAKARKYDELVEDLKEQFMNALDDYENSDENVEAMFTYQAIYNLVQNVLGIGKAKKWYSEYQKEEK